MTGNHTRICVLFLFAATCLTASGVAARAQTATTDTTATTGTKAQTFDAVTIKLNGSGMQGGAWGVSANKYSAKNTPLSRIILQAYLADLAPSSDRLKGAPAWVSSDGYDIVAKADDATAETWKGKMQPEQVKMAAPLLRAMLEDRFKLVAHTVPTETLGYALVVSKRGTKIKESVPGAPVPARVAKFQGGWMVVIAEPGSPPPATIQYLQITMAQLVQNLSMGSAPILDQTGMTGKYDIELPRMDVSPVVPVEGGAPPSRPDAAHMFDWEAVGLEMKPIKVPTLNLVIDHIERPTEN